MLLQRVLFLLIWGMHKTKFGHLVWGEISKNRNCCVISGNPIDCLVGDGLRGRERVINTYCWITSTFTLPTHYNKPIGTHVPAHGIGPYVYGQDEVLYHAYYQWVPFVLFFQVSWYILNLKTLAAVNDHNYFQISITCLL